eukprot:TRINITY_DN103476_c0_g1_i1.p1 TRINITY_DN103476_c0_g1~~TRINITY_DN103476_c0_g1_i1.p1  ORF type:complete len:320 (+),score=47.58 TRINITY_DN103476_c0_g1_i1:68-1027(+)
MTDASWKRLDGGAAPAQLLEELKNNGIPDIQEMIIDVNNTEYANQAAEMFRQNGMVILQNVLPQEQIAKTLAACEREAEKIVANDKKKQGNRGNGRYSFGGASMTRQMLHHPEWVELLKNPFVFEVVKRVTDNKFHVWGAGGDFVVGNTHAYQPLHSDLGGKPNQYKQQDPPYPALLVCNFTVQDLTQLNGPTRILPATHLGDDGIPSLADEPLKYRLSTVCPLPAGCAVIRDCRCWHGGTPNVTDGPRYLPNTEFVGEWWYPEITFPKCLPQEFHATLTPELQQVTTNLVYGDDEKVKTGPRKDTGKPGWWQPLPVAQ